MQLDQQQYARIFSASRDAAVTAARVEKAAIFQRANTLPGLLMELGRANRVLLETIAQEAPDVATAMARGLRNTDDLHATEKVSAPEVQRLNVRDLLPTERICCGTFPNSPHRATCEESRARP